MSWVTGEPTLLLYRGWFLLDAMHKARIMEDEMRAAMRAAGVATWEEVEAVVLETDGSFSVNPPGEENSNDSNLAGLR